MSRKGFLHYLFNKDKAPLYVENKNVLTGNPNDYNKLNGQPAHLQYSPEGWRDVLVKYARNIKYWGLFRDMSVPMKFPKDGFTILHSLMWSAGVEAICYLGIMKLKRDSLPWQYEPWYLTEINFAKYEEDDKVIKVEALEGGLSKYLKAYEGSAYEIEVDNDAEAVNLLSDGMEIANTATFAITDGVGENLAYDRKNHLIDAQLIQKEVDDIGGVNSVNRTQVSNSNVAVRATRKYLFRATVDVTLKIEWDFTITTKFYPPPAMNPSIALNVLFRAIKEDNTVRQPGGVLVLLNRFWGAGQDPRVTNRRLQGTANFQMFAGEELYLLGFVTVEGATGDAQFQFNYGGAEPFVKISYTYRHPPSNIKGLFPYRLAQRIVAKMTDNRYTVRSSFLRSLEHQILITGADDIRGLRNTVIKTSFSDFFKSMNRWGIGVGIEGDELVIEKLAYFFKTTKAVSIGQVTNAKINVAEDLFFNTIVNGYKTQEYREINGRMEFNQGQRWDTPVKKITKELDLKSVYRADPFGIEVLRINLSGKTTTDSGSDNDTFFINVRRDATAGFADAFSFFTATKEIEFSNGAAHVNKFKPGVRFRISGSQFNDKVYTVVNARIQASPFLIVTVKENIVQDEVFVHSTVQFLNYILNRPNYSSVTGLLHPLTAFNIELSPKRSLLENGPMIHSVMDLLDMERISFGTSDKNGDLSTTLAGVTIKENEDIVIGNLPPKLFLPYYFTFTTEVPLNLLQIIKMNPYGQIEFVWKGRNWYGFLFDGGVKPATNDAQVWKLLAAPQNNLKKFNDELL